MKRRGLTVARIVCLLLWILTLTFWIRSHWRNDEWFVIYRTDGCEQVSTLNGDIMVRHERPRDGEYGGFQRISHRSDRVGALPPRPWHEDMLETRWGLFRYLNIPQPNPGVFQQIAQTRAAMVAASQKPARTPEEVSRLLQLQWTLSQQQRTLSVDSYWELVFPLWLLPAAFALPVLLTWALAVIRRRRRIRHGLCPACGYDLRASTERCPECGAPTPVKAATT
ncbi:MAG TPA: zinc ribbon domain-containing protein [Tepidisphaeraceae bacterium]|jgi:hypothetical protein